MGELRRRRVILILHQDRDAAVGGIVGIVFHAQELVGVAAHLRHLIGAHAVLLQQSARRVGAVGRELPVAVICVGGVLRGVCVTLDQQLIGQGFEFGGEQREEFLPVLAELRAAALVEGSVLVFEQFDAQTLRGDGDLNLLDELFQILAWP